MNEQTTDPTLWRYPSLYSPNQTIHIRNLEEKVAELEKRLNPIQHRSGILIPQHPPNDALEEAWWLLERCVDCPDSVFPNWFERRLAWLSAHTPTGKEK